MESTDNLANAAREGRSFAEDRPGTLSNREPLDFAGLDFPEQWELCRQRVEADKRAAKGDLYFIRAGKCVKIGHTINVVTRLAKMQADNHETLDCLLILKGRGHEERQWHERFSDHHIRGEWFRWCEPIAQAVKQGKLENMKASVANA